MKTLYELRRDMAAAYGSWFWRTPGRFNHKPGKEAQAERVALILEYRRARALISGRHWRHDINMHGNIVLRDIDADRALRIAGAIAGDRYAFDSGPCRGWHHIGTRQDAPYFGIWADPVRRRVFTYCEGDRTLVKCPSAETFKAELQSVFQFYRTTAPPALQAFAA